MLQKIQFSVEKIFADKNGVVLSLKGEGNNNLHQSFPVECGIPQLKSTLSLLVDEGKQVVWANTPKMFSVAGPKIEIDPAKVVSGNGRRSDIKELQQALNILKVTTNRSILRACCEVFNQKERKRFGGVKSKEPFRRAIMLVDEATRNNPSL